MYVSLIPFSTQNFTSFTQKIDPSLKKKEPLTTHHTPLPTQYIANQNPPATPSPLSQRHLSPRLAKSPNPIRRARPEPPLKRSAISPSSHTHTYLRAHTHTWRRSIPARRGVTDANLALPGAVRR